MSEKLSSEATAAALFIMLGMVCIVIGIWLIAGLGYAMIMAGVCSIGLGVAAKVELDRRKINEAATALVQSVGASAKRAIDEAKREAEKKEAERRKETFKL